MPLIDVSAKPEPHLFHSQCDDKSASCELCVNIEEWQRNVDASVEQYILIENNEGRRKEQQVDVDEMQRVFSSLESNGSMSLHLKAFSEELLEKNRTHECMLLIRFTIESAVQRKPDQDLLGKCVDALAALYCQVTRDNNMDVVFPALVLRTLNVLVHRIQRFQGLTTLPLNCSLKFRVVNNFVLKIVQEGLVEQLECVLVHFAEIPVWLTSLMKAFSYHMSEQTHIANIHYGETVNHFKEMHEPMKGWNLDYVKDDLDQSAQGLP